MCALCVGVVMGGMCAFACVDDAYVWRDQEAFHCTGRCYKICKKICLKESILQYSYSSSGDKMTGLGV